MASFGANSDPSTLYTMRDLGEEANRIEDLGQAPGLEVVVVNAVQDDVNHVDEKIHKIGAFLFNQDLHQV